MGEVLTHATARVHLQNMALSEKARLQTTRCGVPFPCSFRKGAVETGRGERGLRGWARGGRAVTAGGQGLLVPL